MALTERLQILVDGNAQGAIREFQKLGTAADRELGKTEDRLAKLSGQLTSFGTGLLAGGAVAIGGLKQLADSASAYGEQVSAASVTFGEEGAAQLEKFAEAAADTANISKTEATKAANSFATFARQAGLTGTAAVKFSTDLVQLAGDISSFRDISVADALAALQSGLAGEGEPIRRLGGDISDVALKAEYLAVTGENVTGTLTQQQKVVAINSKLFKDFELAQGDVLRTQDSLANQTRNAQANFENLKTELGTGLVPIFSTVVGAAGDAIASLGNLSDSQADFGGRVAGIATAATIGLGGLSVLGGQAIKLRDTFTDLGDTGERSLNRVGRAARNIAIGGAVIGTLFILDGVLKDVGVSASDVTKNLNDLRAARGPGDALDALLEQAKELDGIGDDIRDIFKGPFNEAQTVKINDTTVEIGNLREALERASNDSETLGNALEGLRAARIESTAPFGLTKGNVDEAFALIDEYEAKLQSSKKAQEVANEELLNFGDASQQVTPPVETFTTTVEGLAVQTEEATNAFKAYSDLLQASTDPFFAAVDSVNAYADAQNKVAEAFKALADGATVEELQAFTDAQRDAVEAGIGIETAIANIRSEVENGNITYQQAFDTLDALKGKYPELAGAVETVKTEFFFAALAAHGLQEELPVQGTVDIETQEAIDRLGAVATAIEAIGIAAEGVRLASLLAETTRDVENAANRNDLLFQEIVNNRDLNGNGVIGRRFGGPVQAGRTYMVGEVGPELFVPRESGTIVPNDQLRGGTLNLTQNIVSADPIQTAAEVVRRQRDAEFLAGV